MKTKYSLLRLSAIIMATTLSMGFLSCSDDNEESHSISASVNGSTNFDINGGKRDIDVTSNTDWTVTVIITEGDEGWLTVNSTNGTGGKTITATATENRTVKNRKATIKFVCTKDATKIIEQTFTQSGLSPSLKVSPTNIQMPSAESEKTPSSFDIECNTEWSIEMDEDWVRIDETSGKGNKTIKVYADDNKDNSKRTAKITISVPNTALSKTVKVTQAEGENLIVTPLDPKLAADKGSTITISITANTNWSISGIPTWISYSSSQGGSGTTNVILTAKERNFSDKERSATITIKSDTKSVTATITQEPAFDSSIQVYTKNELIMSNGYYADLEFSNVLGFHEAYYFKYAFEVKTEEDIYNELLKDDAWGTETFKEVLLYNLYPNTEYVYCCVPYSGEGKSRKYGKMLVQKFTTKSDSEYCDATITGSYNSSYWTYTITKQRRCHHYYRLLFTNAAAELWSSVPPIMVAKLIQDQIKDYKLDYFLNDGLLREPRQKDDYAFLVCTWGVDDQGEFSGNIRGLYANTTATAQERSSTPTNLNGNETNKLLDKKQLHIKFNEMKKHLQIKRK